MPAAELLILTEAFRHGILICYTNYYRANYMGIYGYRCFKDTLNADYSE